MIKEVTGLLVGLATSVIGAVADVSETVCDTRNNNSNTCVQVRELSTACDADDAKGKND